MTAPVTQAHRRRLFGLLAVAPLAPVVGAAPYATGGWVWPGIGEAAPESILPKVGRSKKRRRRTALQEALREAEREACHRRWPLDGELARTLGIAWEDGPDFDKARMYPSDAELAATLGLREGA